MAKNYKKVLKSVLKQIKPSSKERKILNQLSKKTLNLTKKEAKRYNAKAIIAGSLTRNTWLPNKNEFDIFIIFPKTISEKRLENLGLKIGKRVIKKLKGKSVIEYAQHPYVRGKVNDIQIDIVPCYKVESGENIKSAVDRTPFHVKYLNKNLSKKLSDDVRLLKQLCKGNDIYGADTKTEGFSGYVCELLIIKYKGFLNVLKNAVKWKPGEIIDIEKYYDKKDFKKLKKMFNKQSLILIDPTDKKRNAAAAISATSFFTFKKMAKIFLTDPLDEIFFEEKHDPLTEEELITLQMKRRTELLLVKFKPPEVVPDILWPQMRRLADRLEGILKEYEFQVLRKDIYTNEKDLAIVLLEMQISKLPSVDVGVGPPVFDLDDSERFLKKYKKSATAGPYIEKNYWCVEIKREFMSAKEKLVDSLNEKVKILREKGIPKHISSKIAKNFEIITETHKIMELIKKDGNFGVFLREHFNKGSLI
jgi:tRNA nucleotidyltransferase (CCA-adding enzyme)